MIVLGSITDANDTNTSNSSNRPYQGATPPRRVFYSPPMSFPAVMSLIRPAFALIGLLMVTSGVVSILAARRRKRTWHAIPSDSLTLRPMTVRAPFRTSRTSSFSYFVAPVERRQGYGRDLLSALVSVCHDSGIDRVIGFVEPENTASLHTLRAAGFAVSDYPDDERMLKASKTLTDN